MTCASYEAHDSIRQSYSKDLEKAVRNGHHEDTQAYHVCRLSFVAAQLQLLPNGTFIVGI